MSYTIPGRDTGVRNTEPPSAPCVGDFFDKLHCKENGWFLWVGAFCVIVVICGLCSCYVVTPISECLRLWWGADDSKRKTVAVAPAGDDEEANAQEEGAVRRKSNSKRARSKSLDEHSLNHHWYLDDVLKITAEDEMELGPRSPAHTVPTTTTAAEKTTAAAAVALTTSSLAPDYYYHHHHRDKRRDQKKSGFGSPSTSSSARRSSMSSNNGGGVGSHRSLLYAPSRDDGDKTRERAIAANYTRHSRPLTAALVVDDPGIGAEATLRGGGWMGAANGRL